MVVLKVGRSRFLLFAHTWHQCSGDSMQGWKFSQGEGSMCIALLALRFLLQHSRSGIGFPGGAQGKESASQCRRCRRSWFRAWVGKIPWRRKWKPTPVFLPGGSHRQEDPGTLQSIGLQRVRHDRSDRLCQRGSNRITNYRNNTFIWGRNAFVPSPAHQLQSASGNAFVFPLRDMLCLPWALSNFTASWKMNLF